MCRLLFILSIVYVYFRSLFLSFSHLCELIVTDSYEKKSIRISRLFSKWGGKEGVSHFIRVSLVRNGHSKTNRHSKTDKVQLPVLFFLLLNMFLMVYMQSSCAFWEMFVNEGAFVNETISIKIVYAYLCMIIRVNEFNLCIEWMILWRKIKCLHIEQENVFHQRK